ncbi:FG-GAP-like repeat-containing protein [Micromonospora sp. CPCC 206060]
MALGLLVAAVSGPGPGAPVPVAQYADTPTPATVEPGVRPTPVDPVGRLAAPITKPASPIASTTDPARRVPARPTALTPTRPAVRAATTTGGPSRFDLDGDGLDEIVVEGFVQKGDGSWGNGIVIRYSRDGYLQHLLKPSGPLLGSYFGESLTAGDFNGDGYADLVVGDRQEAAVPGDSTTNWAGGIWIFYGGRYPVDPAKAQHLTQDTPGVPGMAAAWNEFGQQLATGDLNGDGYADLAVSADGEAVAGHERAGTVIALFGGTTGIDPGSGRQFSQDSPDVPGVAEPGDWFGDALGIGDVTGDGYADLLVGTGGELEDNDRQNGDNRVTLLPGSPEGPRSLSATQLLARDHEGVSIDVIRVADIDRDGYGDVLAGAPRSAHGALLYVPGAPTGLRAEGARIFRTSTDFYGGVTDPQFFAISIGTGDVTGDGYPDVLLGSEGAPYIGHQRAGAVVLLVGGPDGLNWNRRMSYRQGQAPAHAPRYRMEQPEMWDHFGRSVTILNLDGAGPMDMLVGAPYEKIGEENSPSGVLTRLVIEQRTAVQGHPAPTAVRPVGASRLPAILATKLWYRVDLYKPGGGSISGIGGVLLN